MKTFFYLESENFENETKNAVWFFLLILVAALVCDEENMCGEINVFNLFIIFFAVWNFEFFLSSFRLGENEEFCWFFGGNFVRFC